MQVKEMTGPTTSHETKSLQLQGTVDEAEIKKIKKYNEFNKFLSFPKKLIYLKKKVIKWCVSFTKFYK